MSKPQKAAGPGLKARSKGGKQKRRDNEDEYLYSRNQPLQRPADQENLTDQQLKEEFVRALTSLDPLKPKNLAMWDHVEGTFVPYVDLEQFVVTYSMNSELLEKGSEEMREFKGDLIDDISDIEEDLTKKEAVTKSGPPSIRKLDEERGKRREDGDDAEEKEEKEDLPPPPEKPKKLLNQFNFCERASQTGHNKMRDHTVQTENPSRSQYRDMCNQWIIYDAYQADKNNRPTDKKLHDKAGGGEEAEGEEEATAEGGEKVVKEHGKKGDKDHKKGEKGKDHKDLRVTEKEKVKIRKPSVIEGQAAADLALLKAVDGLRFMERLVATNVFDDVLEDFKYFEDAADEYREAGDGTLLPLWKYSYDKAKKMHATCISWSLSQPDMFVVSYGSFSFVHPLQNGMVVVYTLRNTSFPEFAWSAPKGAMTCHVHPQRNCLVAVGLYDGNVAILNLEKDEQNETRTQVLKNIPTVMKHRAPVWSVKWGADDIDGNPTFYSAGMDGRIMQWVLGVPDIQGIGGLDGTEISTLFLPVPSLTGPDGTTYKLFGCARVLAFHPKQKHTFLVGTAEGKIFRCSSLYGSSFQQIYNAHFLPVAALQWNHYHDDVFISCSEDWTIKIWDQQDTKPMYIYEIGVPILDVCWAPYSSTVFAAVTDEGKVLVYDINVNKEKPICSQQVVTKKKVHPHRVQFNPVYPILVVGDDRGTLTTLKMSPNLRILPKDTRNILLDGEVRIKFEINKMTKLLSLVQDPLSVTHPENIPGSTRTKPFKVGGGGDNKQNA